MYQYGNVAVKYQNENRNRRLNNQQKQQEPKQTSHHQSKTKGQSLLASREKMLSVFAVLIVIATLSLLMARGAMLSEMNYELQALERELEKLEETNAKLEVEVIQLSSPERILAIAQNELGMSMQERTVKILSKSREGDE
ncbi:cell division protein FtsL [Caldalkalibacillus uzonensis]|uniref:Cell division protein FtsL n=1 Tax=Caldalkalibacillus uzonensis TaxID=353224 RepID=A0ABU0CS37_9BACI|nr:cell division protein FtsL [Caldalkalibacillus uzonensis]MDQ0339215.1 cell division protein FtsL [Caldalkalibacillus uzonensis]